MALLINTTALHNYFVIDVKNGRPIAKLIAGCRKELKISPSFLKVLILVLSPQTNVLMIFFGDKIRRQLRKRSQNSSLIKGQEIQKLLRCDCLESLIHLRLINPRLQLNKIIIKKKEEQQISKIRKINFVDDLILCERLNQFLFQIIDSNFNQQIAPLTGMSKKNLHILNPLHSLQKSSKKGRKNEIKDPDDFIARDDSQISEEKSSQQHVFKNLKKLKPMTQEKEKLVQVERPSQGSGTEQLEDSGEQSEQIQYERFGRMDDQGIKKFEEEKNMKGRKKMKMKKGEQQIDKFAQKAIQPQAITKPVKQNKTVVQQSLKDMFKRSSQSQSFQTKIEKESQQDKKKNQSESEEQDSMQFLRRRQMMKNALATNIKQNNLGLSEKQAIQLAIRQSLKEIEKVQPKDHTPLNSYQFKKYENAQKKIQPMKSLSRQAFQKKQKKEPELNKDIKQSKKVEKKKMVDPDTKAGPFKGLAIVTTGQFEPYSKSKILQLLQKLGADLPKSITKKTTHLLQGSYILNSYNKRTDQDPRTTTKSKEAEQKKVRIIPFQQLDNFFVEITGKSLEENMQQGRPKSSQFGLDKYVEIKKQFSAAKTINTEVIDEEKTEKNEDKCPNISWVEKYKPKSSEQIIGQKSQISKLQQWLAVWEDIHIKGNKRDVKPSFNSFMPSGTINSNAALLSGDPGLGKTTTARLVAAQMGYNIVQYNASDARNKKSVEFLSMGKDNLTFHTNKKKEMDKSIIIMDEVDGMSSGDRGGITAIINLIKNTKIPIICICNDRQSTKIRSLAGHCYDLKFHKPDKRMISQRIKQIIEAQGGQVTSIAAEHLTQKLNNDVRQIITYVEMLFRNGTKEFNSQLFEKNCSNVKDNLLTVNPFQATKILLSRTMFKDMSISQRTQLAFSDSDMVPLLVQQNYLSSCAKKKMNLKQFRRLTKAAQSYVSADIMERTIVRNQNYCLMPNKMFLSCVYPAQLVVQNCGFPKFTQYLGKFSSERKNKRLIKELKYMIGGTIAQTLSSIKNNITVLLFERIIRYLKNNQPQYEDIIQFMRFYKITPQILTEHITSLQYGDRQNMLKNIETSKKTKLTKTYNKLFMDGKKQKREKAKNVVEHKKYDPILDQMVDQNDSQEDINDNEESNAEMKESKPKLKKK